MKKNEHTHIFPNVDDVMDFMEKHENVATVLHKKPWGGGKYTTRFPHAEVVLRYPEENYAKVKEILSRYFDNDTVRKTYK